VHRQKGRIFSARTARNRETLRLRAEQDVSYYPFQFARCPDSPPPFLPAPTRLIPANVGSTHFYSWLHFPLIPPTLTLDGGAASPGQVTPWHHPVPDLVPSAALISRRAILRSARPGHSRAQLWRLPPRYRAARYLRRRTNSG
jgi:hypothetical protein